MKLHKKWDEKYNEDERTATSTLQGLKIPKKLWLKRGWQFGKTIIGKIKGLISLDENSNILDLGCGSNGIFAIPAAKMGINSFGVDLSSNALKRLNKRIEKISQIKIKLYQANMVGELPFKDNIFDAVLSTGTICHIKDLDKTISEIERVTKPGGVVYIQSFLNKFHPSHLPYHLINRIREFIGIEMIYYYYRTLPEIKGIFNSKNLKIVKVEKSYGFLPFYETFIYPYNILKLFDFINNKVLTPRLPSGWSIYAQKPK